MGKKIGLGLAAVLIVAVVVGAFFVIKNKRRGVINTDYRDR